MIAMYVTPHFIARRGRRSTTPQPIESRLAASSTTHQMGSGLREAIHMIEAITNPANPAGIMMKLGRQVMISGSLQASLLWLRRYAAAVEGPVPYMKGTVCARSRGAEGGAVAKRTPN
jgi:hypothetical protein